jgi:hypothetical protein
MDLNTIHEALVDLYRRNPHLPHPDGLAQHVLDAWMNATPTVPGQPYRSQAVIEATWAIGARLGAQRGHQVAAAAIRDMVADGLTAGSVPNPEGAQLLAVCARMADELPAQPDTREVTGRVRGLFQWVGQREDLDVALRIGFGHGWLAGHRDAADRLVEHFADEVTAAFGEDKLATLFLTVELTGEDLIAAICSAAYLACEQDQTAAVPPEGRVLQRGRAAGKAFAPIHQAAHTPPAPPPPTAPGRARPGHHRTGNPAPRR